MHLYPLLFSLHEVTVHHLFTAMYLISSSWHLQQVVLDLWIWIWYFFPVSQLSGRVTIFLQLNDVKSACPWSSEKELTISQSGQSCDFELCDEQSGQQCLWLGVTLCLASSLLHTFQWSHKCKIRRVMVGGAELLQNFWPGPCLDDSLLWEL